MFALARTANEATLRSIRLRANVALAIAASTTPHTCGGSSATWLMPDNANSTIHSTSCAQHCATHKPIGDTAHRNPKDSERGRNSECLCEKAELGATNGEVAELPGERTV